MDTLRGNDLKTAVWINEHQSMLVKIGRGIAIALTVLIWLWFIINLIIYIKDYSISKAAEQSVLVTSGNFTTVSRPIAVTILDSGVLDAGSETADAYALVKNPNPLFAARFSYSFNLAGETAEFSDGFLMPNQEQFFVVRGISVEELPENPNFEMQNVVWEKLHGESPNVQFDIAEIAFGAADVVEPIKEEDLEDRTGASETLDPTNANDNTNVNASEETTETDPQVVNNSNEPIRLGNANEDGENTNAETNENVEFATPDDVEELVESDENLTKSDITALSTVVSNNSPVGFRTIYVIAVVRDQNNEVIAIHKQVAKNVNSFDQQPINMNWPRRFIFNAKPEMYIYADYLADENLILLGEE